MAYDEIKKFRWSYSKLTSFKNCKYEFYLNYILRDRESYPPESNYYAEVGSFVHSILEKIFKKELTIDEAPEYYVENFADNVIHKVKKSTMEKSFETCADYFATVDFDWLNDYEILGVELKTPFEYEGYSFIGYIDLLLRDKRDNRIVVVDHKSTEYPLKANGEVKKNSIESLEKYKKQMYLYSYYVWLTYGEYPKEIRWNHFKNGGKFVSVPFNIEEYEKTLKWVIDVIKETEKESDYPEKENYFYCNNLCNFRNSCEYNLEAKENARRNFIKNGSSK